MTKTAILLGATGLIGKELLQLLLLNDSYSKVLIFVRSPIEIVHPKLKVNVINFDTPEDWTDLVKGDELFSSFGTTIKKAGSKENQYKIDVSYQFNIAKAAAQNGVSKYILVSSTGADSKSSMFYYHLKGRLEDKIKELNFKKSIIFRPSVLVGERPEERRGEIFGVKLLNALKFMPFAKKRKPIQGKIVAQSMINAAALDNAEDEYILNDIFNLAKK